MRVIVVVLMAVLAACQAVPPTLSDADKAAMRAVTDSFTVYVVSDRDSAAAAFYSDDATLMPPNQGAAEGRAAIRAFLAGLPPLTEFTAPPTEIDGRGDLAYLRGTYQMTFAAAGGRPAMQDRGKYLEIRRRQTDGTWLIVVDIFNSDLPPR